MLKKNIICTFIFLATQSFCIHAQTQEDLAAINENWGKFYKAFETLDHTLMAEIHSEDLVRISGGSRIIDYKNYIESYKNQFEYSKNNGVTNTIALRFFERISSDKVASERGVYQLTVNKGKKEEKAYYGQFHVIHKKTNGVWKITMDYDSNEGNTIGEEEFTQAFEINNLSKFYPNIFNSKK